MLKLTINDILLTNAQALIQLWHLQEDQVIVITRGLAILELTASISCQMLYTLGAGSFFHSVANTFTDPNTVIYCTTDLDEAEGKEVEYYLKTCQE